MAVKRHFTGRPVQEESSSSDVSESEDGQQSDTQLQETQKGQINKKPQRSSALQARDPAEPIEEEAPEESGDASGGDYGASNSSAGETSSDDQESDSDSGSLLSLQKPVFLSKSQRSGSKLKSKDGRDNERVLKTLEMHNQQDKEAQRQLKDKELNLGGIDDTDALDPEEEQRLFELRKASREERDRAILEKEQDELEEQELRGLRTDEEMEEELREKQKNQTITSFKDKVKGAFFFDEGLRNRKIEGDIEKYDKSLLPQRYDPKRNKQ